MAKPSTAQPAAPAQAPADALAEIETTILRLEELRRQERSKDRQADYRAAIDRLHALAYSCGSSDTFAVACGARHAGYLRGCRPAKTSQELCIAGVSIALTVSSLGKPHYRAG